MFERDLFFNINALARAVNRVWEEAFKEVDLSPAHGYLLRVVLKQPGITQKKIAQELDLAPSTVTRFIDALCERRFIKRQPGEVDARETVIFPTAAGNKLNQKLENISNQAFQNMRKQLGAGDYDKLVKDIRNVKGKVG